MWPALASPHASATAIIRRRMSARFRAFGAHFVMSLDANNRKNNDRRGLVSVVRTAKPHNPPLVGELDNGTHLGGPAVVLCLSGQRTSCPTHTHRPRNN
jgi:hypothetical protein